MVFLRGAVTREGWTHASRQWREAGRDHGLGSRCHLAEPSGAGWLPDQWIPGRVVALTNHLNDAAFHTLVSMDPRPSRRADRQELSMDSDVHSSQWILGRVVALTVEQQHHPSCRHERSQWILGRVVALTFLIRRTRRTQRVSMDPRPSRRADVLLDIRRRHEVVSMDPRPSRRADGKGTTKADWVACLNGSSAESSR